MPDSTKLCYYRTVEDHDRSKLCAVKAPRITANALWSNGDQSNLLLEEMVVPIQCTSMNGAENY